MQRSPLASFALVERSGIAKRWRFALQSSSGKSNSSETIRIAHRLSMLQALQYHEDYAEALASYERALELDAENEDARNNQEQLLSYLRTITDLLACKGRIKPKKFKTLISVLNETRPLSDNVVPLGFLREGENENATYRGTVVASLGVQDVKL